MRWRHSRRSAAGLTLRAHWFVDESIAAELTFDRVPALPQGDPFDNRQQGAALAAVRAAGAAALCAEAVGVMEAAFELTTSFAMTRQQFGKPLGANQAYRHQIAEMAVALETCRSAAAMVAQEVASGEYNGMDLLRAKLLVGLHGRALCQQAVQLHGGIGVTEEYKVGHCLRRMFVIDQMFGDGEWLRRNSLID
ncbi:acyl-CoA dehydrogenase family protein [Ramlibacter sp.]|uniref:acyl-CoA dehydrogenase family protein n=1 Tax=Ramlibacter sp. TaxID=1917967 RepID=UPI0026093AA6|nr:acyl-CoA dehydrogenase family protein [Ramlibacter sp.]